MASNNKFKDSILKCSCDKCRAIVRLLEAGADLRFSEVSAGRLCELAVVAAAGAEGIGAEHVVGERRKYAKHLGIFLSGPISNSDNPVHIQHAINNSNHNPEAVNRINLGSAKAIDKDGRFYIQLAKREMNT